MRNMPSSAGEAARILQQQKHLLFLQRRSNETEAGMELRSGVVDRMGKHGSDPGMFRNRQRPAHRILQHAGGKASAIEDVVGQ